jgi:electron transport complex protein RnfD
MALLKITSPHAHGPLSTSKLMQLVLLATLPGVITLTYFFGWGVITNIAFACITAIAAEALALYLRKKPLKFYLTDYSALVTAVLLGIALPAGSPWWLIMVAVGFAILIAKHLYGGMGYNPFNPAMIGYVVVLISYPLEMTTWAAPLGSFEGSPASLIEAFRALLFGRESIDAITMATPLDVLKQNNSLLLADLWIQNPQFGRWGGLGWEWANLAFLAGGLFLLSRRVFTWHAPISMLISLTLMSLFFYDNGSSASGGSPLFHLLSGATMFGAFFIVTDPVTSAVSNRGRMIYGASIGILLYLIRVWGNYPDAIAFSVLLMNFAAPLLDYYTQPRTYGHKPKKRNTEGGE